jgi:hypothetical protein
VVVQLATIPLGAVSRKVRAHSAHSNPAASLSDHGSGGDDRVERRVETLDSPERQEYRFVKRYHRGGG